MSTRKQPPPPPFRPVPTLNSSSLSLLRIFELANPAPRLDDAPRSQASYRVLLPLTPSPHRCTLQTLTSQKLAEDVELSRAREQLEVQSTKVQNLERVRARVESELATLKADYQHSASEASQLKVRHGEHRDRATALEAETHGQRARLSALGAELDEVSERARGV